LCWDKICPGNASGMSAKGEPLLLGWKVCDASVAGNVTVTTTNISVRRVVVRFDLMGDSFGYGD
jgi:hypothetical protein